MRTKYSKPSADIQVESAIRFQKDKELFEHQISISKILLNCGEREICVLCNHPLKGELFTHRNIPFVLCANCGHIQTRALPPDDYPGVEFKTIYPKLNVGEYKDRKTRIYKPKLDWIINCLKDLNYSKEQIINMRWTEMGAGAGYFLSSLQDIGAQHITGFDADADMVEVANLFIKERKVKHYNGKLSESFKLFPSDVYVAFFVIEHVSDTYQFFIEMKSLPKGTIFVFAVPVFGFSCLLVGIFENNYARNLDCVLHTHLFTDMSIKYGMNLADFEIVEEWIFGQDSLDFTRFIVNNISLKFSEQLLNSIKNDLDKLQDSFQNCLDRQRKSDQRHIIAIKK
jgi:hypothetical protein